MSSPVCRPEVTQLKKNYESNDDYIDYSNSSMQQLNVVKLKHSYFGCKAFCTRTSNYEM